MMNAIQEALGAMKLSEWLTIAAIVLGPVLAVQVEKLVEARREQNRARRGLFHALMATRAARVSPDHVRALNAIDLVFRNDKAVREAWKVYLDHLNDFVFLEKDPDGWSQRSSDYLVNLLAEMSAALKYDFDKVQLRRAIYAPRAHGEAELDSLVIRRSLAKVLSFQQPIPVFLLPGVAPADKAKPVEPMAVESGAIEAKVAKAPE